MVFLFINFFSYYIFLYTIIIYKTNYFYKIFNRLYYQFFPELYYYTIFRSFPDNRAFFIYFYYIRCI